MEYKKKPKIRYCGPDIECIDVVSGELLSAVIRKLAEATCEECDCGYQYITTLYQEGEIFNGTYTNWTVVAPYNLLTYTATASGKYKITLDVGVVDEDAGGRVLVGVSVNNVDPINNFKTQYRLQPGFNSKTVHFIVDVVTGNTMSIKFKDIPSGGVVSIDGIKMLIEKVG